MLFITELCQPLSAIGEVFLYFASLHDGLFYSEYTVELGIFDIIFLLIISYVFINIILDTICIAHTVAYFAFCLFVFASKLLSYTFRAAVNRFVLTGGIIAEMYLDDEHLVARLAGVSLTFTDNAWRSVTIMMLALMAVAPGAVAFIMHHTVLVVELYKGTREFNIDTALYLTGWVNPNKLIPFLPADILATQLFFDPIYVAVTHPDLDMTYVLREICCSYMAALAYPIEHPLTMMTEIVIGCQLALTACLNKCTVNIVALKPVVARAMALKKLALVLPSTEMLLTSPVVEPLAHQAVVAAVNKLFVCTLEQTKDNATPNLEPTPLPVKAASLTASSEVEPFAPQNAALTAETPSCALTVDNSSTTTKPNHSVLSTHPVVEPHAHQTVARFSKPWTCVPAVSKSSTATKSKAAVSSICPVVEPHAHQTMVRTVKPWTCVPAVNGNSTAAKQKAVTSALLLAHSAIQFAVTTKTTMQQMCVLVANKLVAVRCLDSHNAVKAALKPICLLAAQNNASNLRPTQESFATRAKPKILLAGSDKKETSSELKHPIPESRFISSSETLVQDSVDSGSQAESNDWDLVSYDDDVVPKSVKGPKWVWDKTKQKAAKLCQVASSVSLHRCKFKKADVAN